MAKFQREQHEQASQLSAEILKKTEEKERVRREFIEFQRINHLCNAAAHKRTSTDLLQQQYREFLRQEGEKRERYKQQQEQRASQQVQTNQPYQKNHQSLQPTNQNAQHGDLSTSIRSIADRSELLF
jgi:hypothetical protein